MGEMRSVHNFCVDASGKGVSVKAVNESVTLKWLLRS